MDLPLASTVLLDHVQLPHHLPLLTHHLPGTGQPLLPCRLRQQLYLKSRAEKALTFC